MSLSNDAHSDFETETPTRPVPHETMREISARWAAAQAAGVEVATSDRPTRNIRRGVR